MMACVVQLDPRSDATTPSDAAASADHAARRSARCRAAPRRAASPLPCRAAFRCPAVSISVTLGARLLGFAIEYLRRGSGINVIATTDKGQDKAVATELDHPV